MAVVVGRDELERLAQQHAVAEHVARHVADPDTGNHVGPGSKGLRKLRVSLSWASARGPLRHGPGLTFPDGRGVANAKRATDDASVGNGTTHYQNLAIAYVRRGALIFQHAVGSDTVDLSRSAADRGREV